MRKTINMWIPGPLDLSNYIQWIRTPPSGQCFKKVANYNQTNITTIEIYGPSQPPAPHQSLAKCPEHTPITSWGPKVPHTPWTTSPRRPKHVANQATRRPARTALLTHY